MNNTIPALGQRWVQNESNIVIEIIDVFTGTSSQICSGVVFITKIIRVDYLKYKWNRLGDTVQIYTEAFPKYYTYLDGQDRPTNE